MALVLAVGACDVDGNCPIAARADLDAALADERCSELRVLDSWQDGDITITAPRPQMRFTASPFIDHLTLEGFATVFNAAARELDLGHAARAVDVRATERASLTLSPELCPDSDPDGEEGCQAGSSVAIGAGGSIVVDGSAAGRAPWVDGALLVRAGSVSARRDEPPISFLGATFELDVGPIGVLAVDDSASEGGSLTLEQLRSLGTTAKELRLVAPPESVLDAYAAFLVDAQFGGVLAVCAGDEHPPCRRTFTVVGGWSDG